MSKYFTNDVDVSLSHAESIQSSLRTEQNVVPSADNLTNSSQIDENTRKLLTPTKEFRSPKDAIDDEDYIQLVYEQSAEVTESIKKFSNDTKQEIKNVFDKFAPAEIFEKLNQLIYVVTQLNNRVASLEELIQNNSPQITTNVQNNSQPIIKTNSIDTTITETMSTNSDLGIPVNHHTPFSNRPTEVTSEDDQPMMTVAEIKHHLRDITSGKSPSILPTNGYLDKSINLEKIFPNMDDEAYQAAYSSIASAQNKPSLDVAPPTPGKMRGITF
jgi:hypothetical protein